MIEQFIGQPNDYSQVLKRIFVASLAAGIICTITLGYLSPEVWTFINLSAREWSLGPFSLPLTTVLVPMIVAVIARIITLHDLISDVFGIRKFFDVDHVLIPLAQGVGKSVDSEERKKFLKKRHELMRSTFYRYAPNADKAQINPQLVTTAFDRWGWFWSMVEPSAIILVGWLTAWVLIDFHSSLPYLITAALLLLSATFYWPSCIKAAQDEVVEILQDSNRREEILGEFNAIQY